jgi:hypothetical protein
MDIWVIVGVLFGIVAAVLTWWLRRGGTTTKSKITVSGSPGSDVVGRDRGGEGGPGDTGATITVSGSANAKATGRDDRQD